MYNKVPLDIELKFLFKAATEEDETVWIDKVKQAFKEAGYVHIPTGQNVTITTGDNEGGKLMTEQEWREKFND